MNDLIRIRKWLENPKADYKEGLELYDKYKPTNNFDEFLRKGPDTVTHQVLKHKLHQVAHLITANPKYFEKKLIASTAASKPVGSPPTPAIKSPASKSKAPIKQGFDPASLPEKLASLPEELAKSYARIQEIAPLLGGLHAKLKASQDAGESQKVIKELEYLDREKRSRWADIDSYLGKDGKERDVKKSDAPVKDDKETDLRKQLKNTRDSLNRIKRTMDQQKKSKPHLVKKSAEAIAKYEKKIEEIENELKKLVKN